MKTLIIALTFSIIALGQEAKIMIVEKQDSQKLAKAYRDYKDALKRWEEVKAEVARQYTYLGGAPPKPMEGWERVQFSADFRAIVPETSLWARNGVTCGTYLTSGVNTFTSRLPVGAVSSSSDLGQWATTDAGGIADSSVRTDVIVKEKNR